MILKGQTQLHLRARPLRHALLIDPSKRSSSEIDDIFLYCLHHWGGTWNVIVPLFDKSISDDWFYLLKAQDPDVVIYFDEIDLQTAKKIITEIQPIELFQFQKSSKITFGDKNNFEALSFPGVELESLDSLDRQRIAKMVHLYYEDLKSNPETLSFCIRNFGVLSKKTLQTVAPREGISVNNIQNPTHILHILRSLEMGSYILPNTLASAFDGREVADSTIATFEGGFHVVVGDSNEDILYAWNRGTLKLPHSDYPTLIVSAQQLSEASFLDEIAFWIEKRFFVQAPQTNKVVSFSESDDLINHVCVALSSRIKKQFTPTKLKSGQFPIQGPQERKSDYWFMSELIQVPDFSNFTGNEYMAPTPLGIQRKSMLNCRWMVDIKIAPDYQQENAYFPNSEGWLLPKRIGLGSKFTWPPHGNQRITNSGFISTPAANGNEVVNVKIPSSTDFFSCLLERYGVTGSGKEQFHPVREISKYGSLKTSSNGALLSKVITLFGGLHDAAGIFSNKAWLTIFSQLAGANIGNSISDILTNQIQGPEKTLESEELVTILNRLFLTQKEKSVAQNYKQIRDLWQYSVRVLKKEHKLSFPEEFPKKQFEFFLQKKILLQGSQIKCPSCQMHYWLTIDELEHTVVCSGCRDSFHVGNLTFSYKLNSLIATAISIQGILPVIETLQELSHSTQNCFAFLPSQDIFDSSNKQLTDLDIIAYQDFSFYVGEVKSSKHAAMKVLNESTAKLILELNPTKFVLSSPADSYDIEFLQAVSDFEKQYFSSKKIIKLIHQKWNPVDLHREKHKSEKVT